MAASPVFLWIGSSNMRGALQANGRPTSYAPHLLTDDAGIKIWTGSAFATQAVGVNTSATCDDGSVASQWGPVAEFSYQHRLAYPGKTIYNVVCAYGGTDLNGLWHPNAGSSKVGLTTTHLSGAYTALSGLNPYLAGIVWDNGYPASASSTATYQAWLEDLKAAAIANWGANALTCWSIHKLSTSVVGTMTDPQRNNIRAAQTAFVAANSSNMSLIDIDGLAVQSDTLHMTPASLLTVGQRDFAAFQASRRRYTAGWS